MKTYVITECGRTELTTNGVSSATHYLLKTQVKETATFRYPAPDTDGFDIVNMTFGKWWEREIALALKRGWIRLATKEEMLVYSLRGEL